MTSLCLLQMRQPHGCRLYRVQYVGESDFLVQNSAPLIEHNVSTQ